MSEQRAPSAGVRYASETVDIAIEGAEAYDRDDLVARLTAARRLLTGPAVTVYVVGEFKQGKSSLVNALVGTSVCPVDDDIATAVPTLVEFSRVPRASATYEPEEGEPGSPWTARIPVDAVGDHVAEQGNPGNRRRLRSVTVGVDRDLLRSGLVLVDTPGVGGLGSVQNALTASALPSAHAVIFVSDASQELTEAELRFLRTAAELCPTIIFALTKTDLYPHWRRILDLDVGHLSRSGLVVDAVPVSPEARLLAAELADPDLDEESGIPGLERRLVEVLDDVERIALQAVGTQVLAVLSGLIPVLTARAAALARPGECADLVAELHRARDRADKLRDRSARWQQLLSDGFADISADTDFDLRVRTRAVLAEAETKIDEGDPAKDWPEFEKWLRSRLATETLESYARFTKAAEELAERVAEHFELVETQVVTVKAPVGLLDAMAIKSSVLEPPPRIAGKMVIFQRSFGGVMMFTILTNMASLVIPAPLGLAAGLLMGRSAFREERKRALEKRRFETKSAVRRFIDDFTMQVGKDSRDAVRRAQREMRTRYAERAEELRRSASEAISAAQRAVRTEEDAADERRRLDNDLKMFAALRSRTEQMLARTRRDPVHQ